MDENGLHLLEIPSITSADSPDGGTDLFTKIRQKNRGDLSTSLNRTQKRQEKSF
jgi:hypothetical protein